MVTPEVLLFFISLNALMLFQVDREEVVSDNMASSRTGECSGQVFSAKNMSVLFQECAKSENAQEVDMDCYLNAWEELIRLVIPLV